MGNQYGMKDKLNEKLAGAKNTKEAQEIIDKFKSFNKNGDNSIDGFDANKDKNGNMKVQKGSEADELLKWLGLTPTYTRTGR
jgi:hypothetical protein